MPMLIDVNLLSQSQSVTAAAWNYTHLSGTTNATTAPDGSNTGAKLVEDSTTNFHNVELRAPTITSQSVNLIVSIYVKKAQRNLAIQIFKSDYSSEAWAVYDLTNNVVGGSFANTGFTILGSGLITDSLATGSGNNGWYRAYLAVTAPADTVWPVDFYLTNAAGVINSYAGDGSSGVYVWGAQQNFGSTLEPYVQTTTSAIYYPSTQLYDPARLYDRRPLSQAGHIDPTAPWQIAAVSGLTGLPFWNDHSAPYRRIDNPLAAQFVDPTAPWQLAAVYGWLGQPFRTDHSAPYDPRNAPRAPYTQAPDQKALTLITGLIGLPFWNDHRAPFDPRNAPIATQTEWYAGTTQSQFAAVNGWLQQPFRTDHSAPYSRIDNRQASFIGQSDPKYLFQVYGLLGQPFWNPHPVPFAPLNAPWAPYTQGSDPKALSLVTGLIGLPFYNDHRAPYDRRDNRYASLSWGDPKYLVNPTPTTPLWNDHSAPYSRLDNRQASFIWPTNPKYIGDVQALLGQPFSNDHRAPYDPRINTSAAFVHQSDPNYLLQETGLTGLPFWNPHPVPYSPLANPNAGFLWQSDSDYLAQVGGLTGLPFWNPHPAPYDLRQALGFIAPTALWNLATVSGLPFYNDHSAPYDRRQAARDLIAGTAPWTLDALGELGEPFYNDHRAPYNPLLKTADFTLPLGLWQLAAVTGELGDPFWNPHAIPYDARIAAKDWVAGTAPWLLDTLGLLGAPFKNPHPAPYDARRAAGDLIGSVVTPRLDAITGLTGLPFWNDHRAPFDARLKAPDFARGSGPIQLDSISGQAGLPFSNPHPAPYDARKAAGDFVAGIAAPGLDQLNLPFSGQFRPPYSPLSAVPGLSAGTSPELLPPPPPFLGLALPIPYDMRRGSETAPQSTDPIIFPPAFSGRLPFWTDHSAPFDPRADKKSAQFYAASDPKYLPVSGYPFWNDHRAPYSQLSNATASFTQASGPQWLAAVSGLSGLPFANAYPAPYDARRDASKPQWPTGPIILDQLGELGEPFRNDHAAPYDRRPAKDFIAGTEPWTLDAIKLPFWNAHDAPYARGDDRSPKLIGPIFPVQLDQITGLPFRNDHAAARTRADLLQKAPEQQQPAQALALDQVNVPGQAFEAAKYDPRRALDGQSQYTPPNAIDAVNVPGQASEYAPFDRRRALDGQNKPTLPGELNQVFVPGQATEQTLFDPRRAWPGLIQGTAPWTIDQTTLPFRTRHDVPYADLRVWQPFYPVTSSALFPPSVGGFPFWNQHPATYSPMLNMFASFMRPPPPALIPALFPENILYASTQTFVLGA